MKTLFFFLMLLFLSCDYNISPTQDVPPNIIILLADDLGYGDLGCYGGDALTPNLDRLAEGGIRFTDFYAASSNCSPSRTGLLTGRSPSKVGVYNYIPPVHPMHLRDEEITIAEVVKKAGYRTGHFGKWHLSNLDSLELGQPSPADQGFEYSLGTTNNARPTHLDPVNFVRNGIPTGKIKGYSCDIVVDEALKWIDEGVTDETPFLMFLAFHEPHKVVASPPELTAKYDSFQKQDAEYLANVENMDEAIGTLLDSLKTLFLDENTLILFASDNGSYRNGSNGALLGGKSFVYEGGIRVPGILNWNGHIEPGQTIHEPAGLIDVMPTICELVNVEHDRQNLMEGTSLMPLFSKIPLQRVKPLNWFFYRTSPEMAMRIGDYSIMGKSTEMTMHTHPMTEPDMDHIRNLTLDEFEFYNLREDLGQQNMLNSSSIDQGEQYKDLLHQQLMEIQKSGYYWDTLPPAKGNKKLKSEWRHLRPQGFSN